MYFIASFTASRDLLSFQEFIRTEILSVLSSFFYRVIFYSIVKFNVAVAWLFPLGERWMVRIKERQEVEVCVCLYPSCLEFMCSTNPFSDWFKILIKIQAIEYSVLSVRGRSSDLRINTHTCMQHESVVAQLTKFQFQIECKVYKIWRNRSTRRGKSNKKQALFLRQPHADLP